MGTNTQFVESPGRAIFLNAEIDQAIFQRIAPEIVKLRQPLSGPICLYIDSLGGNVQLSERILDLIKCPSQSGEVPWLITVAYGYAASAAANLLALGDYAIVYPTAMIHHHGTRQIGPEVRLEDINLIANGLRETNERLASKLASRMFQRMVFLTITSSLVSESVDSTSASFSLASTVSSPTKFFEHLASKVSPQSQNVLKRALERQKRIDELVRIIESKGLIKAGPASVDQDANILKEIVDFEADLIKRAHAAYPQDIAVITYEQADMIKSDYRELYEYFFGTFRTQLHEIIVSQGLSFLLPDEQATHASLPSDIERTNFVREKVEPRLEPLWYLVVSLCRSLQEGENTLTPEDAYWLGLVDEVIGTNLPCYRTMVEQPPSEAD